MNKTASKLRPGYNTKLIKIMKGKHFSRENDKFLHKIQRQKMRELWDNKEDKAWERA